MNKLFLTDNFLLDFVYASSTCNPTIWYVLLHFKLFTITEYIIKLYDIVCL